MDIEWDDARLFLAVAEHGSVSAAARALRFAQPTVSRRLRELEDALGFPLFERGTSGATLTTRGERLLEPAKKMAEWASELARAAEKKQSKPSGLVRVTAPPGVAFDFLAPFAGWLRTAHPELRLEVLSSVEYLDLARGQADLAIRMGVPKKPTRDLVVVAERAASIGAYASRAYVARLKPGYTVVDVDWIAWAPPYERLPPSAQLAAAIPDFTPAFTADDFLVQWRAAESGAGAIVLGDLGHRFSTTRSTTGARQGLVRLDIDLSRYGRAQLQLVAAKSALDVPRVRAIAHLLERELAHTTVDARVNDAAASRRRR